jgi:amino acid transporter
MVGELKERLPVPLAIITVLGFIFGLPFGGVMVGFSVLFFAYFVLAIPATPIFLWMIRYQASWYWYLLGALFLGVSVAVILTGIPEVEHDDLGRLTASSGAGMFIVLGIVVYGAWLLRFNYRENHKPCRECMNTVHAEARVCQYCGYRWEPPLPPFRQERSR